MFFNLLNISLIFIPLLFLIIYFLWVCNKSWEFVINAEERNQWWNCTAYALCSGKRAKTNRIETHHCIRRKMWENVGAIFDKMRKKRRQSAHARALSRARRHLGKKLKKGWGNKGIRKKVVCDLEHGKKQRFSFRCAKWSEMFWGYLKWDRRKAPIAEMRVPLPRDHFKYIAQTCNEPGLCIRFFFFRNATWFDNVITCGNLLIP